MNAVPLLIAVLREPERMAGLPLARWELLLRQALAANLTASLYCLAEEHATPFRPSPVVTSNGPPC